MSSYEDRIRAIELYIKPAKRAGTASSKQIAGRADADAIGQLALMFRCLTIAPHLASSFFMNAVISARVVG